jgi:hypothetical protein
MEEVTFTSTERVEAAEAGLAKSVLCTLATPKSASKACFVFAIRGSASVLDYMVNLNGDAKEVGDFIVSKSTEVY